MKSLKFNLSCLIQVGAFATLLLSSSVYANPYDGTWKVTTSCGPNVINKRPAFSIDDEIKITNGFIHSKSSLTSPIGKEKFLANL